MSNTSVQPESLREYLAHLPMTDEQRAELAGCTSFSELHKRLASSTFDAPNEAAQASVGRRLTLRLKIKDPSKATEMRAALVRPLVPVELPATGHSVTTLAKADKVAKQQSEKEQANEQTGEQKEAKAVKASAAAAEPTPTPQEPEQAEQVLTETWSYQLPADE